MVLFVKIITRTLGMLGKLLLQMRIIIISMFVFGSVVFYFQLDSYHLNKAIKTAKANLLYTDAMQVYVDAHMKSFVYSLESERKLSKDFFNPSILSSTFMVSAVNEIYKHRALEQKTDIDIVEFKFASDNPTNMNNKADERESKILKKLSSSKSALYENRIERNGKDVLILASPVRKNTKSCLRCHGNPSDAPKDMLELYGDKNGFGEKVGDIRAISVIYVVVDASGEKMKFFITIELLMLAVFVGIYFILRHFVVELSQKDKFIAKQSRFAALGEMISMIAHQWRQPLTGMGMSVNNMLLDIDLEDMDEKRFKENLELINLQIGYLSTTIDDFKNFFKPNAELEEVSVLKLIQSSCMVIDSSLRSNAIEIVISIDENIKVLTRKNDVTQIILNLVKNSMDAYLERSDEKRVINISAVKASERVEITVQDFAGGIPKEIVDKIFDPYFSTKDKKNGTGLGLYMSKMIAEDHLGGYLDVRVEGESTIFKLVLVQKG